MEDEKRTKLQSLCRARWVKRHYAFEVIVDYPAIIDALHSILDSEKRHDAVADTNGILHSITTFSFVVTLLVVMRCIGYLKELSISLQGTALEVATVFKDIQVVKSVLEENRVNIETFYQEIYEAVTLAEKVGISLSVPRRCGRQTQIGNIPSSSVEELFRRTITVPFFDYLKGKLQTRFD